MKTFNSLISFSKYLKNVAVKEIVFIHSGLEKCAKLIEDSAKDEIGHLQPEVGPFPAWSPLTQSTISEKIRLGYVYNEDYNPLYRTGELQASISHTVNANEALIGSTSPIMIYHEFGTYKMPMRPVIGPAAYKNKYNIEAILGSSIIAAFGGYIQNISSEAFTLTQLSEGYYKDL
jgi:HK97 gp10 family phage protein